MMKSSKPPPPMPAKKKARGAIFRRGHYFTYVLSTADRNHVHINSSFDLAERMKILRNSTGLSNDLPNLPRFLVYFSVHPTAIGALSEVANLRKMKVKRLQEFIAKENPAWRDLCADFMRIPEYRGIYPWMLEEAPAKRRMKFIY